MTNVNWKIKIFNEPKDKITIIKLLQKLKQYNISFNSTYIDMDEKSNETAKLIDNQNGDTPTLVLGQRFFDTPDKAKEENFQLHTLLHEIGHYTTNPKFKNHIKTYNKYRIETNNKEEIIIGHLLQLPQEIAAEEYVQKLSPELYRIRQNEATKISEQLRSTINGQYLKLTAILLTNTSHTTPFLDYLDKHNHLRAATLYKILLEDKNRFTNEILKTAIKLIESKCSK